MLSTTQLKKLVLLAGEVGAEEALLLIYIYGACRELDKTKGISSIKCSALGAIQNKLALRSIHDDIHALSDMFGYLEVKNGSITYTQKAHDLFRKPVKKKETYTYTPEFEVLWKDYGRLGSKPNAFNEWSMLTSGERDKVINTLKLYLKGTTANRTKEAKKQWRRDLERYLRDRMFEMFEEEEEQTFEVNSPEWFAQMKKNLRKIN